jgi:hypothetical protein
MGNQPNRTAIVISALLTALILTVAGVGVSAYNGWLPINGNQSKITADTPLQEAPIVVTVQPVLQPELQQAAPAVPAEASTGQNFDAQAQGQANSEVINAYQTQLEQAYQALQEAYNQIDALQSAQNQNVSSSFNGEYEDDEGEYREGGDDDRGHEEREHEERERGEREHGEGEYDND